MPANIYIQNKYLNWYNSIILNAQSKDRQKGLGEYFESHHIIPRGMGGNDTPKNLVLLTPKEHFTCHHLLTKFSPNNATMKAFWMMCNLYKEKVTAIIYESIKSKYSKSILGVNNPNSDGKFSKKSWDNASKERHINQSNIMRENNIKYKTKPKESRQYNCTWCNSIINKLEFVHREPKENYYCDATCRNRQTAKNKYGR